MKPTVARASLVLTVFALVGTLSVTERYVVEYYRPAPPPAPPPSAQQSGQSAVPSATTRAPMPPPVPFVSEFRYNLAWALLTPAIFYLARRFPLLGRQRSRALLVHLLVPIAGSLPFFCYRILLNTVFGAEFPTWKVIANVPWGRVLVLQSASAMPVYWLLVGLGTFVQIARDHAAQELRETDLRRSLAAAQLDALQLKLQPHFLFNTLNTIASLAQSGDTEGAGRVVERLGTLLRLTMETGAHQLVTLDEELASVEAYLSIEEARFGDRLRIVRRIAPETRRALVPTLILQPLIENALVHGLSRRLDASLLEVAARRDGHVLHIAVRDDGPGVPAGWNLDANAGAGLRNVIERLRALYPGASAFRLENEATGGAVAVLSIPFADAATTAIAAEWQPWTA